MVARTYTYLMKYLPKSVLVSNVKTGARFNVNKHSALTEFKFIELNRGTTTSISVDVDAPKRGSISLEDMYTRLDCMKIPRPSMMLATPNGGWHLHWFLKAPVVESSIVALRYVVAVRSMITAMVSGDLAAHGLIRSWRNFFLGESTVVGDSFYEIGDFKHLLVKENKKKFKRSLAKFKKDTIDLTTIQCGERHISLFEVSRHHAYSLFAEFGRSGYREVFYNKLCDLNNLLPEPLDADEVNSIFKAVCTFTDGMKQTERKTEAVTEYNRKLAADRMDACRKRLVSAVKRKKFDLNTVTLVALAKAAKVTDKTARKHKPWLLEFFGYTTKVEEAVEQINEDKGTTNEDKGTTNERPGTVYARYDSVRACGRVAYNPCNTVRWYPSAKRLLI